MYTLERLNLLFWLDFIPNGKLNTTICIFEW
jgi:hypothetical protein